MVKLLPLLILSFLTYSVNSFQNQLYFPVSEFNEFKPRLKSLKNRVHLSASLNPWKIKYNVKWNQPNLSLGLNLSRGSNSLNSASGWSDKWNK